MSTNKYFDSLRGDTTEGVLKQYGTETEKFNAVRDNLQPITPDPRNMPFYEAAGFQPDPNNQGAVVTASRQLSDYIDQRELRRQQRLSQEYQDTKGSALFRVGDTLADAGRLFLSPLFWLSGEDTTKYDPSAMVDAGYKKQMAYSQDLRTGMYDKLLKARDARQLHMHNLQKDYLTNQKTVQELNTPAGTPMKELIAYGRAVTGNPEFRLPTGMEPLRQLQQQKDLAQGEAIALQGTQGSQHIFNATEIPFAEKIATTFNQRTKPHLEAFNALKKLRSSLGSNGAIAQVAAITQFNKILDPGSVVRESEVDLIKSARSMVSEIEGFIKQAGTGQGLSTAQIAELGTLAGNLESIYRKEYKIVRNQAQQKFRNMGKDDPVVFDHFLGADMTPVDSDDISNSVVRVPEPTFDGTGMFRTNQNQPSVSGQDQLLQDFNKLMQIDYSAMGQN